MGFSTSHSESGEGARGIKTAVDRCLDWLTRAEPGTAPVKWRLTMSFKESDLEAAENEGMRRSGDLFEKPVKRGPGRPRKHPLPPPPIEDETEMVVEMDNMADEDD